MASYYKLGSPKAVTINKTISAADLDGVTISVDNVPLSHCVFDGKLFGGDEVELSSTTVSSNAVIQWVVSIIGSDATPSVQRYDGPSCTFTLPSTCFRAEINAVIGTPDDIRLPFASDAPYDVPSAVDSRYRRPGYYDLRGVRSDAPHSGLNIVRSADGALRKIWY